MALKVGKIVKKTLKVLGVFLLLFIAAAVAIPYFYKDEILDAGKKFANEQMNATLDFDNDKVSLSLLWTFPDFSFNIGDLTVTGQQEFEGKKLADIGNFNFTLNLMDVWNGNYTINSIELNEADLYVKVLRNGKANYDIMKPSDSPTTAKEEPTTSESGDLKFELKRYAVTKTNVIFDDETSDIYVEIKNLNHSGDGKFTLTNYDLHTLTEIEELTVVMDRIKYFRKTNVEVTFNANINTSTGKYKLLDNSFRLNALVLKAEGEINQRAAGAMKLDLKFSTPNTAFSSVLSMVPAAYIKDYEAVKTKGTFSFDAYVKGIYNSNTDAIPAFGLNLKINKGEFKYPDLPMAVEDINADISVNSASADLDKMALDVRKFHIKVGKNPFDAKLRLRTPLSDPDIDAKIDGTVNLGELAKAFPMEDVQKLSGIVKANLVAKTKLSYIDNSQYEKVDLKGFLSVANVDYFSKDYPKIKIKNIAMDFTPNAVDLKDFDLKIGKSDIKAVGKLDNILTYFSREKIMKGRLQVKSKLLDLNEIAGTESSTTKESSPATENTATAMQDTTEATDEMPIFDQFDFEMTVNFDRIIYDVYDITNLKTVGNFTPAKANLSRFEMKIGKVDLQADGTVENVFGYLFDEEVLTGRLNLYSDYMNLNQFMSESGEATEPQAAKEVPADVSEVESDLEPMQIPGNIDLTFTAKFKRMIYDVYDLKNMYAEARVYKHILDISTLRADGFGGAMAMHGLYNTQNPEKPKFEFSYDVKKLDIQAIAKTVGLAKRFVPILESVYGKFNSNFKIEGDLDKNLYPDLSTLAVDGLLKTYDAIVKKSTSLNSLSQQLKIPEIKTLELTNTTNFFHIKDGKFIIDPASHKIKGMDIIFGGAHGLDNSMDYDIKMRVPRSLLNKTKAGQTANNLANTGLGALSGQASKLGIKIEQSEFVNLGIDVGGTVKKPKFGIKLLGAEGKKGETLGDQVSNTIKEEADKIAKDAKAKFDQEAARLKAEAEAKLTAEKERLRKEAEAKARKLAAQAAKDPASAVDSLKNTINNIGKGGLPNVKNPFGGGKDDKDKKGNKKPFGGIKNPFGG